MTTKGKTATPQPGRRPAPGTLPPRPGRRSILGFGLVATAALGASGYFLWPALRQAGRAATAEVTPVSISMSGFAPNELRAKVGVPVELQLINRDNSMHSDGGGWHQFAIDTLGLDFKVAPLSEQRVRFVVDQPGTYDYYCGVCCGGKANPYMHGTLLVEA